jgi:methylglutaconyl-CoA hydratase
MEEFQTIMLDKQPRHTTIWLNRPQKRNALDEVMMTELTEAVEAVYRENQQRVIILRGKGKTFSAGADLEMMQNLGKPGETGENRLPQLLAVLSGSAIPVIAVAHGPVFGGAIGILAACDISLAVSDTVFAFSEVKIGLVPAVIAPYVMRRLGEFRAKEYMLTGMKFSAMEAERSGLINRSVPEDSLEEYLDFLTGNIFESGPEAVRTCKMMISRIANDWSFDQSLGETERLIRSVSGSDEAQERIQSFLTRKERNADE